MSTTKTYLIISAPSHSTTAIFMDEDAIIDAYLNPTDTKNYILGFTEFLRLYDRIQRYGFGNIAITESGYPILLFNNESWLMIEASDMFDAIKKAEQILHERIKHTKTN